MGLLWSFALVPLVVGDLNSITAFLLMILFGMGIDHSIHLAKRFQAELGVLDAEASLLETYRSTGRSVATAGLTTALALTILSLTGFRGFSEFGIISGFSTLVVLVSMFGVMPAALVLGERWGLVGAKAPMASSWGALPGRGKTLALAAAVLVAGLAGPWFLRFDYNFQELQTETETMSAIRKVHKQVYPGDLTPGAIYVARDLEVLDQALSQLETAKREKPDAAIGPTGELAGVHATSPGGGAASEDSR